MVVAAIPPSRRPTAMPITSPAAPAPLQLHPQPAAQVAQALGEDHGHLRDLTARLHGTTDRDALTDVLEDLAASLRQHFAQEEHAAGFFGMLTARGPAHQAETAQLVAEHRELLRDLGHLVAQAHERPAPTAALMHMAAELTARLHDHEARETKLVQALA
jgi:hypothetical protein